MNVYRVNQLNDQDKAISNKTFQTEEEANNFARAESLKNIKDTFNVEKKDEKDDEEDYLIISIYKQGSLLASFDDVRQISND